MADSVSKGVKIPSVRLCALLWDESFLWGLMSYKALKASGLPFHLIRAEDIRKGRLSSYQMIFVPGGWAASKLSALGREGCEEICRFVKSGGSYLGICGGAGLATEDGLGLLPIKRRPQNERVPSFSGPVKLDLITHALWQNVVDPCFFAWWPSQFLLESDDVKVLARYQEALPGAFSADIPIADGERMGWSRLEKIYGIYLDPGRLQGEPAVVEGSYGVGRVILSLIHFDTPDAANSAVVLKNIWRYLIPSFTNSDTTGADMLRGKTVGVNSSAVIPIVQDLQAMIADLISTGMNNFLWFWRTPLLLSWRRGVRGLEYSTLSVMLEEIGRILVDNKAKKHCPGSRHDGEDGLLSLEEELLMIREEMRYFVFKAKELIIRERLYMMGGPLTPIACADGEINELRNQLFGPAMSHGGLFKALIAHVDRLLYRLLKQCGQ